MAFSVKPWSRSKKDQHLLQNNSKNIAIRKFSTLEVQTLYEVIQENIKVVKQLFKNENEDT